MPGPPTPKDRFTALDALALVRELRALGPARVEKAFDDPDGGWSLTLRGSEAGRWELKLVPGRYAALSAGRQLHEGELSPMARDLRRLLGGAVVRSVADPGAERYLEVQLSRADEPDGITLAVEFFGSGNLVVARGGRIAAVARPRAWAHRTVRIGSEYVRPPSRTDPWSLGTAEIEAELERTRSDLASTLAARLALGGPIAEELIARGDWHDAPPGKSLGPIAPKLRGVMQELLREIGEHPAGFLYRREGVLVDATPYRSTRWKGLAVEESLPSFSDAAAAFYPTTLLRGPTERERAERAAREELERLADRQRRAVADLASAVNERREAGTLVLSHYPQVEAALEAARRREPVPPEVELTLDGRARTVPTARDARASAQRLFAEAKRLAEKLEGARAALAETEARQAAPPATGPSQERPPRPGPAERPFWFERYRWFLTSDGAVAIAGRDATSNDLIVRRNLKPGDVYVHADLHGAASVVLKRSPAGVPPSEASLREACQWAAAFSKAWKAGYATATAFWAEPDQVSKSAASGEFVAKGAWVVHGTKHFVRDAPLELALGTIRHEGRERWTVAPEAAVRAHGTVRFLLTPGEERDRRTREAELVAALGIDRSLLQRLLPAGGLSLRRA